MVQAVRHFHLPRVAVRRNRISQDKLPGFPYAAYRLQVQPALARWRCVVLWWEPSAAAMTVAGTFAHAEYVPRLLLATASVQVRRVHGRVLKTAMALAKDLQRWTLQTVGGWPTQGQPRYAFRASCSGRCR